MEVKDCESLAKRFEDILERRIVVGEGFAEKMNSMLTRLEEVLREANEEHVLMPVVGVVAARAAALVYLTLRRVGSSEEEALREAKVQLCAAARMAEKLLETMVREGLLEPRGGGEGGAASSERR
ncbi:hypothetical protein Pyrfu_0085 [Pyrolobus fumarii 1A]|uniref:Uncharacterized protein n=1 Tax=Pyrolobus fumarii (strain DSM 11204 / 1A) TaxID=694429 RepID=G0EE41_PYRF1|nr:hypothetical protein [Pyrolobus fumarii]AEM37957.1 hypothetical protein Pyrfu_0085 [Pyrolobus fumarii 1A]